MSLTKKEVDSYWADMVKESAGYMCEIPGCNKEEFLVSHHIVGRKIHSVRWDLENGVCVCNYHHIWSKHSAHENPLFFLDKMIILRGGEWWESLVKKADKLYKQKSYNEIFRRLQGETGNMPRG